MSVDLDLKARERSLEREQEDWKQGQADRQRQLEKLRAEIEVLEPKAELLRRTIQDYQTEVAELEGTLAAKTARIINISREVTDYSQRREDLAKRILLEEDRLVGLQREADQRLTEYETNQWAAADKRVAQLKVTEQELQARIDSHKHDLLAWDIESAKAKERSTAQTRAAETQLAAVLAEVEKLTGQCRGLGAMVIKRQAEADALFARNREALSLQRAIDAQAANFKAYEHRAWEQLNAMDASLQEREAAVEQREQLRPSRKSFLPPLSD